MNKGSQAELIARLLCYAKDGDEVHEFVGGLPSDLAAGLAHLFERGKDRWFLTLLSIAVPGWIDKLRPLSWDDLRARADRAADVIASGDSMERARAHRGKVKSGAVAAEFNAIAEALACLAFLPGGVRFYRLHFEAHPPGDPPSPG